MRKITLDIETSNAAPGRIDPASMQLALVGIHDSESDTYDSFLEDDLPKLWAILERADAIIGYNSDHFDIPILNRYYPGDLTKIKSIDLLTDVRNSLGRRIKLDSIAEATLGRKKVGSGLDAIRWWEQGEVEKVRHYCIEDVKITKQIYDFALKNGYIKYNDFGEAQKVPIDTSAWEESNDKESMTHTLPF